MENHQLMHYEYCKYCNEILTNDKDKILPKVQETHKKKVYKFRFFERNKEINDPNQVIIKFSSYQLNDVEKSLLAKEINFALPAKILDHADYLLPFEMVYRNIKTVDVPSSNFDIIKVALNEYTCSSCKKYNFFKKLNLSRDEYNDFKNLSPLKNIVIQRETL